MSKGYICNFDKSEEYLYKMAVKEFGKGLYIDTNAFWKDGHKDDKLLALKCVGEVNLSEFWKILERIKNDSINLKLCCSCGNSEKNKDILLNSHMGFSVRNPEDIAVVETYKCNACGKTYEFVINPTPKGGGLRK